jgi:hypothetical protein
MHIYPSPKLADTEYLPGIGADGADLPEEEAQALLDAGLAVKTKPKAPAQPAESEDKP